MAKRDDLNTSGPGRGNEADSKTESKEQRLVAFAEQLGWIVGTIQGKAEGWLDSDVMTAQISKVRDSASALLDQLRPATIAESRQIARAKTDGAGSRDKTALRSKGGGKGRSRGAVDAPGKKHRKPMPSESGATGTPRGEGSRIAKLKARNQNRLQRRG